MDRRPSAFVPLWFGSWLTASNRDEHRANHRANQWDLAWSPYHAVMQDSYRIGADEKQLQVRLLI